MLSKAKESKIVRMKERVTEVKWNCKVTASCCPPAANSISSVLKWWSQLQKSTRIFISDSFGSTNPTDRPSVNFTSVIFFYHCINGFVGENENYADNNINDDDLNMMMKQNTTNTMCTETKRISLCHVLLWVREWKVNDSTHSCHLKSISVHLNHMRDEQTLYSLYRHHFGIDH